MNTIDEDLFRQKQKAMQKENDNSEIRKQNFE